MTELEPTEAKEGSYSAIKQERGSNCHFLTRDWTGWLIALFSH